MHPSQVIPSMVSVTVVSLACRAEIGRPVTMEAIAVAASWRTCRRVIMAGSLDLPSDFSKLPTVWEPRKGERARRDINE